MWYQITELNELKLSICLLNPQSQLLSYMMLKKNVLVSRTFPLMICFAIISETWLFASGFWVEIPFEIELVLGMYWTEGSETLMNVTKKYLSFWDGQKFRSLFKFKSIYAHTFRSFFSAFVCYKQGRNAENSYGLRFHSMMLQGLHSNIPRPLTLQHTSFLYKKLNQKNIGNVLASEIWTFCVDIINDSDWNCGCSKEELAFSSHLRHLESQLECYNLQRQNYLGDRHRDYPSKSSQ